MNDTDATIDLSIESETITSNLDEGAPVSEDEVYPAATEDSAEVELPDPIEELSAGLPNLSAARIEEICDTKRYRELRMLGLSVDEAYRATVKRREAPDSRAHLSVSVAGGAAPRSAGISDTDLRSAREIFGGMSDAEIRRLYKRVTT